MKKVLITGVTRGLGLEIAKQFINKGHVVFGLGSSDDVLSLEDKYGIKGYKCDIRNSKQVKDNVSKILDNNKIDILVNNAGVGAFGNIEDMTEEQYDKMFDTNIKGMFLVTKEVVMQMKSSKKGQIINISSDVGRRTIAGGALYAASKYAVEGFSGSINKELREFGIKVSIINPGLIDTYFNGNTQGVNQVEHIKVQDLANTIIYISEAPDYLVFDRIILHPIAQDYDIN